MKGGRQTLQESVLPESMVKLIAPPSRLPLSPAEGFTVELLRQYGSAPLPFVVDQVALKFYLDEIRNGAWALDLGLLGPGMFVRQVLQDLEAGDGILWHIEREEKPNELLPDLS